MQNDMYIYIHNQDICICVHPCSGAAVHQAPATDINSEPSQPEWPSLGVEQHDLQDHAVSESDPWSDQEEGACPGSASSSNTNASPENDSSDSSSNSSEYGSSDSEEERAAEDPGGSDDDTASGSSRAGDQPAWRGSTISRDQFTYAVMCIKRDTRQSNVCFSQWLDFVKKIVSPGEKNNVPSSLFRCLSIMHVKKLSGCRWHACPCGHYSWDPEGPSSPEDKCPHRGCRLSRWKHRAPDGTLTPRQVRTVSPFLGTLPGGFLTECMETLG